MFGSDVNLEASDPEVIRYFRSDRGLAKKEQALPDRFGRLGDIGLETVAAIRAFYSMRDR